MYKTPIGNLSTPEGNNGDILSNINKFTIIYEDIPFIIYLSTIQNNSKIKIIHKSEDELMFQYEIIIDLNGFQKTNQFFKTYSSLEEIFDYLLIKFMSKEVFIQRFIPGKELKIYIEVIGLDGMPKKINFPLTFTKVDEPTIILNLCKCVQNMNQSMQKLSQENSQLKQEIKQLKYEIDSLKNNKININNSDFGVNRSKSNNISFISSVNDNEKKNPYLFSVEAPGGEGIPFQLDPKNLKIYKNLVENSLCPKSIECFAIFRSIRNENLLVYGNKHKSLVSVDIESGSSKKIDNAHREFITLIRHFISISFPKDLILSCSCYNGNIKIWAVENWQLLFDKSQIYSSGEIYSACLLFKTNDFFVVTSSESESEYIKVFAKNTSLAKEINNSKDNTYFIDIYFDKEKNKNYIIDANYKNIKSFDYESNQVYQTYVDNTDSTTKKCYYKGFIVFGVTNQTKLIGINDLGIVNVWDFNNGEILLKITDCLNIPLNCLCLWNEQFLLAGGNDNYLKVFDLINGKLVQNLKSNNDGKYGINSIIKIRGDNLGECLVTQGRNDSKDTKILLWGRSK